MLGTTLDISAVLLEGLDGVYCWVLWALSVKQPEFLLLTVIII